MITRDESIKMAREAGFSAKHTGVYFDRQIVDLARAAYEAGAKAEREAILREAHPAHYVDGRCEIVPVAAIRARGEK